MYVADGCRFVLQVALDKIRDRTPERMALLDMGLISSMRGRMQVPHADVVSCNNGWIVIHLLDAEDPPYFYMGETPCEQVQRTVLGMDKNSFKKARQEYPNDFKALAPLLQPKDDILDG